MSAQSSSVATSVAFNGEGPPQPPHFGAEGEFTGPGGFNSQQSRKFRKFPWIWR
uniref:Uncharacterized protein n=1 Tax=Tetranychus urticae TaxID=32264 RepID=T1KQM6_TETUR